MYYINLKISPMKEEKADELNRHMQQNSHHISVVVKLAPDFGFVNGVKNALVMKERCEDTVSRAYQWFSTGEFLTPRGHLAMSRGIFGCHLEEGVAAGSSG